MVYIVELEYNKYISMSKQYLDFYNSYQILMYLYDKRINQPIIEFRYNEYENRLNVMVFTLSQIFCKDYIPYLKNENRFDHYGKNGKSCHRQRIGHEVIPTSGPKGQTIVGPEIGMLRNII